jgi:hypothetical protein
MSKTAMTVTELVIALGIGPNTAMFSVIYGVFLSDWGEGDRLMVLWAKPRDNGIRNRGSCKNSGGRN